MATYTNLSSLFTNIANVIRNKRNINISIPANSFPEAITAIPDDRLSTYAQNGLSEFIDDNITEIRDFAFLGDRALKTVSCANVSTVGVGGLAGDLYFTILLITGDYNTVDGGQLETLSLPKCQILKSGAIAAQSYLTSVYLPSVTTIERNAFAFCLSLTEAIFPFVTSLGRSAFSGCSEMTIASFPLMSEVPGRCFSDCIKLSSVYFPLATKIGDEAFGNCTALTEASFSLVTTISQSAFAGCTSLKSIYFPGEFVTLTGGHIFESTPMIVPNQSGEYGSIYVPASLLTRYQSETNWAVYSSRFVAI